MQTAVDVGFIEVGLFTDLEHGAKLVLVGHQEAGFP